MRYLQVFVGYATKLWVLQVEQLLCIMEVLGLPPKQLVDTSTRKKIFFDSNSMPRIVANSRGKKRRPGSKSLAQALKCTDKLFLDFLEGCLKWDPKERMSPEDGLKHTWILEALAQAQAQAQARTSSTSAR
jgi:serine/threonine protein kinase